MKHLVPYLLTSLTLHLLGTPFLFRAYTRGKGTAYLEIAFRPRAPASAFVMPSTVSRINQINQLNRINKGHSVPKTEKEKENEREREMARAQEVEIPELGSSELGLKTVYPRLSRLMGEEGLVLVEFSWSPGGEIREVEIAQSSGFARIDQAAETAIRTLPRERLLARAEPTRAARVRFQFKLKPSE